MRTTPTEQIDKLLRKYSIAEPRSGFDIGVGWLSHVEKLIVKLIDLGWDKELHQVKEKFGSLRFYIGPTLNNEIRETIYKAEDETRFICEDCGEKGKIWNMKGLLVCLCDQHKESFVK